MPILKAQLAPPAMKEAIVLDLGDLGAQAAKIRMQAQAQAEQIIEDARAQAGSIAAQSQQEAEERGHAEGLARGIAEGQEQGKAQALAEAKDAIDQLTAAWSAVASQWETQRTAMERDARQAVTAFALQATEKIVHRVIDLDPDTATRQVDAALGLVLSQHDIAIRIHPGDRAAVEQALPQLVSEIGNLGHVSLVEDESIGKGGCKMAIGNGQIDATIQTQLDRVAALVLPEAQATDADDAAAPPTPGPLAQPPRDDAESEDQTPPGSEV